MFRDFVSNELCTASQGVGPNSSPESRLKEVFDGIAEAVDTIADHGPLVGGTTLGILADCLHDKKPENKRAFLKLSTALILGFFTDRVMPDAANRISVSTAAHPYETMFAIVRRQRQRR